MNKTFFYNLLNHGHVVWFFYFTFATHFTLENTNWKWQIFYKDDGTFNLPQTHCSTGIKNKIWILGILIPPLVRRSAAAVVFARGHHGCFCSNPGPAARDVVCLHRVLPFGHFVHQEVLYSETWKLPVIAIGVFTN